MVINAIKYHPVQKPFHTPSWNKKNLNIYLIKVKLQHKHFKKYLTDIRSKLFMFTSHKVGISLQSGMPAEQNPGGGVQDFGTDMPVALRFGDFFRSMQKTVNHYLSGRT